MADGDDETRTRSRSPVDGDAGSSVDSTTDNIPSEDASINPVR